MSTQLYQPTNLQTTALADGQYELSFEMDIPEQEGVEEIGSWAQGDTLNAVFNAIGDGDESGVTRTVTVRAVFSSVGTNKLQVVVAKKGKVRGTTMISYG